jgi:hypothetical protein
VARIVVLGNPRLWRLDIQFRHRWIPTSAHRRLHIQKPRIRRRLGMRPSIYLDLGDGFNIYAYVHGDPLNGIDPTGLCDDLGNAGGSGDTVPEITVCGPQKQPDPGLQNQQPPVGGGGNGVPLGSAPKQPQKAQKGRCSTVAARAAKNWGDMSTELAVAGFGAQNAAIALSRLNQPGAAAWAEMGAGGAEALSLYYGFWNAAANIVNGNNVPGSILGIVAGLSRASQLGHYMASGAGLAGSLATDDSAQKAGKCP